MVTIPALYLATLVIGLVVGFYLGRQYAISATRRAVNEARVRSMEAALAEINKPQEINIHEYGVPE